LRVGLRDRDDPIVLGLPKLLARLLPRPEELAEQPSQPLRPRNSGHVQPPCTRGCGLAASPRRLYARAGASVRPFADKPVTFCVLDRRACRPKRRLTDPPPPCRARRWRRGPCSISGRS